MGNVSVFVVMAGLESMELVCNAKPHAKSVLLMWRIVQLALVSSMLMKGNVLYSVLWRLQYLMIIIWLVLIALLLARLALIWPQHVHHALLEQIFITVNVYKHAQIQPIHQLKYVCLVKLPAFPAHLLQYVHHA